VRGRRRQAGSEGTLAQYVNDRPYVASSFLTVALAQVLGSALRGSCKDRPDLADTAIPLEASDAADNVRGGPNYHLSLTQGRINFLKHGISDPDREDLREHQDNRGPNHASACRLSCAAGSRSAMIGR
jgi:hypothetical protein